MESFQKEPQQKPAGGIVQADDLMEVEPTGRIVPGTGLEAVQQTAADVFPGKNGQGIGESPYKDRVILQQPVRKKQETAHSVNGKHPDGGLSNQPPVPAAKALEGGKQDFGKPAGGTTIKKVF